MLERTNLKLLQSYSRAVHTQRMRILGISCLVPEEKKLKCFPADILKMDIMQPLSKPMEAGTVKQVE